MAASPSKLIDLLIEYIQGLVDNEEQTTDAGEPEEDEDNLPQSVPGCIQLVGQHLNLVRRIKFSINPMRPGRQYRAPPPPITLWQAPQL